MNISASTRGSYEIALRSSSPLPPCLLFFNLSPYFLISHRMRSLFACIFTVKQDSSAINWRLSMLRLFHPLARIYGRRSARQAARLLFINSETMEGKTQKFAQRSKDIGHESKKTWEHGRSLPLFPPDRDLTAINSAFKLPLLAAVNKGKLIQIKIQFVRYLLFLCGTKILVIL